MAVNIVPVGSDRKLLDRFLKVPYAVYGDDPHVVFPLLDEQKKFFDRSHNPFYQHAETELWLAVKGGRDVGRVAACIDSTNNDYHHEKVGFFGFYEVQDDDEAAAALLRTAADWIVARGMDTMRGPGCFTSNHDWYGLQVDGRFDRPLIGMPYNPRYYEKQLTAFGLTGAKDLFAWWLETRGELPPKMQPLVDRVLERPGLVIRPFDMKHFSEEAELVRGLYNACWGENWGFIPLSDAEFAYLAKDMKALVSADFLLVAEMEGKPVGFSLTIPDFNQAMQPLRGKLLPFGWLQFLLNKRKVRSARTILMGVLPEYRKLGIDVGMVSQTMRAAFAKGITHGECSWILADNRPMNRILEGYGADCYKTYRVYEKKLA